MILEYYYVAPGIAIEDILLIIRLCFYLECIRDPEEPPVNLEL